MSSRKRCSCTRSRCTHGPVVERDEAGPAAHDRQHAAEPPGRALGVAHHLDVVAGLVDEAAGEPVERQTSGCISSANAGTTEARSRPEVTAAVMRRSTSTRAERRAARRRAGRCRARCRPACPAASSPSASSDGSLPARARGAPSRRAALPGAQRRRRPAARLRAARARAARSWASTVAARAERPRSSAARCCSAAGRGSPSSPTRTSRRRRARARRRRARGSSAAAPAPRARP